MNKDAARLNSTRLEALHTPMYYFCGADSVSVDWEAFHDVEKSALIVHTSTSNAHLLERRR